MLTLKEHELLIRAIDSVWRRCEARREFVFWKRYLVPQFNKDGSRSKVDGSRWKCDLCQKELRYNQYDVDHISPVVPLDRTTLEMTWSEYIERRVCSPMTNLQLICKPCHKKKSLAERRQRKAIQTARTERQNPNKSEP